MDRGVRAIVSHRLPNAEELNAGCGDWLECCQAYIHAEGCAEATNPTNERREQAREIATHRTQPFHKFVNRIAIALSSRDAEIREVLEGLATYRNPLCWCPPNTEAEPHTEACRATAVLYAKLQPTQINGASSTPKG